MPLDPQEEHCVLLACRYLAHAIGGEWTIPPGPTLDELYPREPSPEVVVGNGTKTAAIEVKQLTGDTVLRAYMEAMVSLRRRLAPSCGGQYLLSPPSDLHPPVDKKLMAWLKREIERVAPTLSPGDVGAVRYQRTAPLEFVRGDTPGMLFCTHGDDDVRALSPQLDGTYFLGDGDELEHSFVTDRGRADFLASTKAAADEAKSGGVARMEWYEEWALARGPDDPDEPSGVEISAGTEARDVSEMVEDAVGQMLSQGREKFIRRRWADYHVLVFENKAILTNQQRVSEYLAALAPREIAPVDLVLLVEKDNVSTVWTATPTGGVRDGR